MQATNTLCLLGLRARLCPALPVFLACLILFVVCLTAGTAQAARADASPLRVALLLENAADDHGAAALMQEGLARAQAQTGAATTVLVAGPEDDPLAVFCQAAKEHDLVLVGEAGLHAVLRSNAGNFRNTSFGCIDTSVLGLRAANIMSVTFADNEPAFLAGAAAALLTDKDQKLGWLESESTPVRETLLAGFVAGAQVSRPDIRIVRRELAAGANGVRHSLEEMAAEKVGLVVLATGYATRAALDALAATPLAGIGLDRDQSALAPEKIPFSVVKRFDRAVEELVLAKANGTFQGRKTLVYSLANGGTDLVFGRTFLKTHPQAARVQRRVQELRRELANGNIVLEDKRVPTLCDCLD